jgi:hypothetical protein
MPHAPSPQRCAAALLLLSLLVPASGAQAQSVVVRVGATTDAACDSFSLPGAIARLPALGPAVRHRILLSNNQTYEADAQITDRSVSIEGGYDDCSDTTPNAFARTTVRPTPTSSDPLLRVRSTASAVFEVTLDTLDLARDTATAGGGIAAEGPVNLIVVHSNVREFGAIDAEIGGISLRNGAWLFLRGITEVIANQARAGAGISCSEGRVHIESSDVLIAGNSAQAAGGGLRLVDCQLRWDPDTSSIQGGITGNFATIGGGIYAERSSISWTNAAPLPFGPRRVVANRTAYDGAGILLVDDSSMALPAIDMRSNEAGTDPRPASTGNCGALMVLSESSATLSSFYIAGNSARRDGAAICVQDRSSFRVGDPRECADGACRLIANNRGGTGVAAGSGGAFRIDDSSLFLFATRVVDNSAPSNAFMQVTDAAPATPRSRVEIVNSVIARNVSSNSTLMQFGGADVAIDFSTFADNRAPNAMLLDAGGSTLALATSILQGEAGRPVLAAPLGSTLSTRCLIAHESGSLFGQGGEARVVLPGFVDAAGDDYALNDTSQARDACAADPDGGTTVDIGQQSRPVDLPLPDIAGPWDIGAYEMRSGTSELFRDGFE